MLRKNSLKGYTLTSKSTGDKTFTKGLKPILLHPGRLDFVPYLPHTAGRTARIIEEIYGISFTNPPLEIKNQASINDEIIKLNFEKYSNYKWVELSKNTIYQHWWYQLNGILICNRFFKVTNLLFIYFKNYKDYHSNLFVKTRLIFVK